MAEQVVDLAQRTDRAGKYLTFFLARQEYGVEILKVREIIGMVQITPVPRTPEFVRGVINLRGKVIPVIDLRSKFDMEPADQTGETCVIVVDVDRLEIGVVVDKVSEVMAIAGEEIEDTPSFGVEVSTDFILGIGKTGGKVTILLDISRVLTDTQIDTISQLERKASPGEV